MADADRERWDARHAAGHDAEVEPVPPDALRGRGRLVIGDGRALDVACGRGATAVWLARRGVLVDAVDVAPVGLAAGVTLARRHAVAERVRWWCHDLDDGLPCGCHGPYDVVVCQRFRDPALYPALFGRLACGGLLVVTVLSEVGGSPGPWRARSGELLAELGGLAGVEVLAHTEGDGEAHLLARRVC